MITAPVTFAKISAELELPANTPLSGYAGLRVYDGVLGRNVDLPTSPLKYSDFLNKTKAFPEIAPPTITITKQPLDRNTFFGIGLVTFNLEFTMTRPDYGTSGLIPNRVRTSIVWQDSADNGATWNVLKTETLTSKEGSFKSNVAVDATSANNGRSYRAVITSRDLFFDNTNNTETELLVTGVTSRTAKLNLTVAESSPICLNVATLSDKTITIQRDLIGNLITSGSGKLTFSNLSYCAIIGPVGPDIVDTGWMTVDQFWYSGNVYTLEYPSDFIWWDGRPVFDNSLTTGSTHAQGLNSTATTSIAGYRAGVDASEVVDYGVRVLAKASKYSPTMLRLSNSISGASLPIGARPADSISPKAIFLPVNGASSVSWANPKLGTATLGPTWSGWQTGAAQADSNLEVTGVTGPGEAGFSIGGMTEAGYNALTGNDPQVLEWWKTPTFTMQGSGLFGVPTSEARYVQIRILYRPKQ